MTGIFEYASSNLDVVGWAIAFVVFLIIEGVTLNALVSIWFAGAALFAMIAAIIGLSFTWQLVVFAVYSAVLLVVTKSLVKHFRGSRKKDPTTEHEIGKNATVIESIDNTTGEGRVKLDGTYWAARSFTGENLTEGTIVTVREIDGTKLIVSKAIVNVQ